MSHTDSIEANVESSEVHVERGTEQLQRAAYYQVQHCRFNISITLFCYSTMSIISDLFLSLSSPEKITQEDVYSGFSAFLSGDYLRHYYLASY